MKGMVKTMIEKAEFGFSNGYKVFLFTLKNSSGMTLKLTNYSAAIVSIFVPDKNGNYDDVVLGYDDLAGYEAGTSSQGAVVGRYANRIGNGQFTINGETFELYKNDGPNTLHGGSVGFNKRVWTVEETTDNSVTFGYFSPDGEENFPGNLKVSCTYTLTEENEVKINYKGVSDKDTVLNLTNHSYFNLGGIHSGSILGNELQIFADTYTPVNKQLIPTGEIASVEGTAFDFRQPKAIMKDLENFGIIGYDNNFMLGEPHVMKKAAVLFDPVSGREMTVSTDKPAIQLYTAIGLQGEIGKDGEMMKIQTAVCLESQYAPDSPNQPAFPDCVLKAGEEYNFTTIYGFSVRK